MVSDFLYKRMLLLVALLGVTEDSTCPIAQCSFVSHPREICFLISTAQIMFLVRKKKSFLSYGRGDSFDDHISRSTLDPGRLRVPL